MKNTVRILCIVIGLTVSWGSNANEHTNTISVTGSGLVNITPNSFSFDMVIEERGQSVAELNEKASSKIQNIVRFLVTHGVDAGKIESMDINLQPWVEHKREQGTVYKGYILTRTVSVTHNNIEDYDVLIDGVTQNRINRVQSFRLMHTGAENFANQALINATKDAKLKASLIAGEMGATLGKVLSVNVISNRPVPMQPMRAMHEMAVTALPGKQTLSASVEVVFEIKN